MKTKTKSRTNLMRKVFSFLAVVVVLAMTFALPAMAATDAPAPEQSAQEMANKYFDNAWTVFTIIVDFIGGIIFVWGIVMLAMSMNSHDASQKTNGLTAVFCGVIVFAAPWLLQMIKG